MVDPRFVQDEWTQGTLHHTIAKRVMSTLQSVASIPEDLMSSFGLYRQQAHRWCMYINIHKIHIKNFNPCHVYEYMFIVQSDVSWWYFHFTLTCSSAIFTPLPSYTSLCYFTFISILLQSALPFSFALPSEPRSNCVECGSLASHSQNYCNRNR